MLAVTLVTALPAAAHPLGNFTIDHYARLRLSGGQLGIRYILDMAELPTLEELPRLDVDGDGRASAAESAAYLDRAMPALTAAVRATAAGERLAWKIDGRSALLIPTASGGAGGPVSSLRIVLDMHADLPTAARRQRWLLSYRDGNYPARAGWKEIVFDPGDGVRVLQASAAFTDRSRQLTTFPAAVLVPPQELAADLEVSTVAGQGSGGVRSMWLAAAAVIVTLLVIWRRKGSRS